MRTIGHSLAAIYILTAADGYTTACYDNHESLDREVSRLGLLAPITVAHWVQARAVNGDKLTPIHVLKERFTWPS